MKDWKFIKIGNTAHSDKVEVIKKLLSGGWSVQDIYEQLKTDGYEVEKNFIEKLKTGNSEAENSYTYPQAEGTKTGNENVKETNISGKNGSGVITRMNNLYFAAYNLSSGEKGIEKFPTESQAISFLKQKTGNESIEKQTWSMFKGLTKKAEEEVGNDESDLIKRGFVYKVIIPGKKPIYFNNPRQAQIAAEAQKGTVEKVGNKKVGNTNWKQTGSKKWETELPNGSKIVVYYEKGEMADWNYQIDHKKSNTYIGSWARDKQEAMTESVERAKRLGNSKTGNAQTYINGEWKDTKSPKEQLIEYAKKSNDPEYLEHVKKMTNPNDINARLQWHKKSGNETLAEYAKSKPRIINETKAERKFGKVMGEFEEGSLKTPQGKTVTDPAQAKAIAYSEADKVDNLKRARNAMNKKCGNQQITLWDGNDSALISEDGTVQYLESNSFEVDRDKYDSQQKAVEELTKQGYRKK